MFGPDLFSDPVPKFHPAANQAAAQVVEMLAAHYPALGAASSEVRQSGAMELNSNNFLIEAGGGRLIVKRWPLTAQHATLRTQAALAEWLARQGQPIPAPCAAASRELVVEHQGFGWCVMDYVDAGYFSGAGEQLGQAAAAITALFRALQSVPANLQPKRRIEHPVQDWRVLLEKLQRDRGALSETESALLRQEWPAVTAALADAVALAPVLESASLCHIDLHPHNVLVSGGRVAALLDFPSLVLAPAPSMHAFNLFKLARQAMVARGAKTPPADLLRQLQGAPRDPARLAKAEILRRLMLILQLNVESGNRDWNHVLPVMLLALREADVLFAA
jgi:Ser/Thr protein kinase RdoA (MazF antagonist)